MKKIKIRTFNSKGEHTQTTETAELYTVRSAMAELRLMGFMPYEEAGMATRKHRLPKCWTRLFADGGSANAYIL